MQYNAAFYDELKLDEASFFKAFPKRPEDAHKGSTGRILLISGSYGMAGAACLNILGAKALGAPYIHVVLPEDIYPIVAARHVTPVFHPIGKASLNEDLGSLLSQVTAVAFGSGAVRNEYKNEILEQLMSDCSCPLVLDAEALNLLVNRQYILQKAKCPVIITPHPGEFRAFTRLTPQQIAEDPLKAAIESSEEYYVITVLKGHRTVVASPDGRIYVNETGNQGLAQAGSGDVLTGMITAMLSFTEDPFEAACMAVFAHGLAADRLCEKHSYQCMPLEDIPAVMDELFKGHGY